MGIQARKNVESPAKIGANQGVKLPGLDSNQEWRNQNPQCYHYTTGQYCLTACISQRTIYGKSAAMSYWNSRPQGPLPNTLGIALHLQAFGHGKGDLL